MTTFNITIPPIIFKTRVEKDQSPGFEWKDVKTEELFLGKRVALFGVPGAFTPTCSSTHLPGYEANYHELKKCGIDEVYCISVNDSFVMNAWFSSLDIKHVKAIPDGTGEFSRRMGYLVYKNNVGFGPRSWRYSMVVNDGAVEMVWEEPGIQDNAPGDPFVVSDVYHMLDYLQAKDVSS